MNSDSAEFARLWDALGAHFRSQYLLMALSCGASQTKFLSNISKSSWWVPRERSRWGQFRLLIDYFPPSIQCKTRFSVVYVAFHQTPKGVGWINVCFVGPHLCLSFWGPLMNSQPVNGLKVKEWLHSCTGCGAIHTSQKWASCIRLNRLFELSYWIGLRSGPITMTCQALLSYLGCYGIAYTCIWFLPWIRIWPFRSVGGPSF